MNDFETITVNVSVRPYSPDTGVVSWHMNDEFIDIGIGRGDDTVAIRGNREGLRALARELLTLAQDQVPLGSSVYLMSKGQAPTLAEDSAALHISLAE
jgi:hypothetical protein